MTYWLYWILHFFWHYWPLIFSAHMAFKFYRWIALPRKQARLEDKNYLTLESANIAEGEKLAKKYFPGKLWASEAEIEQVKKRKKADKALDKIINELEEMDDDPPEPKKDFGGMSVASISKSIHSQYPDCTFINFSPPKYNESIYVSFEDGSTMLLTAFRLNSNQIAFKVVSQRDNPDNYDDGCISVSKEHLRQLVNKPTRMNATELRRIRKYGTGSREQ